MYVPCLNVYVIGSCSHRSAKQQCRMPPLVKGFLLMITWVSSLLGCMDKDRQHTWNPWKHSWIPVQKRRLEWKLPRGAVGGELLSKVGPALLINANPCGTEKKHFCPVSSIELIEDSICLTKRGCWPHLLIIRQKLWGWRPGDSWFPIWNAPNLLIAPFQPLPNLDLSFSQVFCIQIKNNVH